MVQLGEGKILGSRAFVASIVGELEAKLGWHPAPKKMGIEMDLAGDGPCKVPVH